MPLTARLSASVPPAVKITSDGRAPQRRGQLLARLLDAPAGPAAGPVQRGGVAEFAQRIRDGRRPPRAAWASSPRGRGRASRSSLRRRATQPSRGRTCSPANGRTRPDRRRRSAAGSPRRRRRRPTAARRRRSSSASPATPVGVGIELPALEFGREPLLGVRPGDGHQVDGHPAAARRSPHAASKVARAARTPRPACRR